VRVGPVFAPFSIAKPNLVEDWALWDFIQIVGLPTVRLQQSEGESEK